MQRGLAVRNHGFDFDHEDDSCRPMKREHIDRPSPAPDRERDFDRDLPSGCAKQEDDQLNQLGMGFIEEPIQLLTVPPNANVDRSADGSSNADEGTDRHGLEHPALDARDHSPREPRNATDVLLAKLLANAERAELPSDTDRIHPPIMR